MTENDDDLVEFVSPKETISPEVLALWAAGDLGHDAVAVVRLLELRQKDGWFDSLPPQTNTWLADEAAGFAEAPDDDEVDGARLTRSELVAVTVPAVQCGYLMARMALGTVAEHPHWPRLIPAQVFDGYITHMAIDELADLGPVGFAEAGVDVVALLTGDDNVEDEDVRMNVGLMGFDGAVAFAVMEHEAFVWDSQR